MGRVKATKFNYEVLKELKGTICCNCGIDYGNEIMFHHIVPLSFGGIDKITNIIPICTSCHKILHGINKDNDEVKQSFSALVKAGIERARQEGKQIGGIKGKKLNVKKSMPAKEIILANSIHFNGTLNNNECIKLANIAPNTFYKYKKELLEEFPQYKL